MALEVRIKGSPLDHSQNQRWAERKWLEAPMAFPKAFLCQKWENKDKIQMECLFE